MLEEDPSGKNPHEPGAKLDKGKNKVGVVLSGFPWALEAVAKVGTYGIEKYTKNGHLEVPDGKERYLDAAMRHMISHWKGEKKDAASNIDHLAHAAWCLLAVVELGCREELND